MIEAAAAKAIERSVGASNASMKSTYHKKRSAILRSIEVVSEPECLPLRGSSVNETV